MAYQTAFNLTSIDYGSEISTVRARGIPLTAANFDAEVAKWEDLQDAITGAVNGITIGNHVALAIAHTEPSGLGPPTSPQAQRETKWLVHFHSSSTGKKYQMEIPCADLSLLDPNARDRMLVSSGNGANFVTKFEAAVRAPDDGTSVLFDYALHVGRNT